MQIWFHLLNQLYGMFEFLYQIVIQFLCYYMVIEFVLREHLKEIIPLPIGGKRYYLIWLIFCSFLIGIKTQISHTLKFHAFCLILLSRGTVKMPTLNVLFVISTFYLLIYVPSFAGFPIS